MNSSFRRQSNSNKNKLSQKRSIPNENKWIQELKKREKKRREQMKREKKELEQMRKELKQREYEISFTKMSKGEEIEPLNDIASVYTVYL